MVQMSCVHLWLPTYGIAHRYVFCVHCLERRRVAWRFRRPRPTSIGQALGEAIDRKVIDTNEVLWGGKRLR
jgi:hypothetical protein